MVQINFHQRGQGSLAPIAYLTKKYEEICYDCLNSLGEKKVDNKKMTYRVFYM